MTCEGNLARGIPGLADSLVFGMPKQKEEESVRDVVFMWKDNETSLDAAPGPDFRSMDKSAVHMGLTKSPEFRDFRCAAHYSTHSGPSASHDPRVTRRACGQRLP